MKLDIIKEKNRNTFHIKYKDKYNIQLDIHTPYIRFNKTGLNISCSNDINLVFDNGDCNIGLVILGFGFNFWMININKRIW